MEPSKHILRLIEIMAALRTPKTGCPWDLEQTFASIAPYTIEEAYEVADAIERNDMEDLRLELGDLLLQSVYHARMAEEAGYFDFGDVVEGITRKMIRRHPHVFGNEDVTASQYSASGMAKDTWERIKTEEKLEEEERRTALGLPPKMKGTSVLDDVATTLPALTTALKLQKKAGKNGFDWNNVGAVLEKIEEELSELRLEISNGNADKIEDEIGDVLFSIANLARHLDTDPEKALKRTNRKFRSRFAHIEKRAKENHRAIEQMGLDEMEFYWQEAKSVE